MNSLLCPREFFHGFRKVPVCNACVHDPYTSFAEVGIAIGWENGSGKSLIGQTLGVTTPMSLPAKNSSRESATYPEGILHESNSAPLPATVSVRIGLGVPLRAGKSRPGV